MSLRAYTSLCVPDQYLWLAVTTGVVACVYTVPQMVSTLRNRVPLPPGPPARWFWQSALPTVNTTRTLADWIEEYGPVITLRHGNHVTIVIGRVDAAIEILEREGGALLDRPRSVAAGELVSGGLRLLLTGAGERFRRLRKAVHSHMRAKEVIVYQDIQFEHATNVITDILNDPKNHRGHVQRYAASVILRWTYGKSTPTSSNDPEVVQIRQTMTNLQHSMRPGAFLVERVPLLKYIPGYTSLLKQYHKSEIQLFGDQMKRVQSDMESNKGGDSFMKALLEHSDEYQLSRDEMAYLGGSSFNAGAESTAVGITNMILAAASHPEAQKRVQEELDVVVGKDRLPNWEDSRSLPQLHAFLLETHRWRSIFPNAPHRAIQDIIWRGQRIPAGATVIGCTWAISHDPVVFPNPEKFDPQRWIDDQGRLRTDMYNTFPYGYGRRICPGQHFANRSLYINLALLLWSFQIVERADAPIDVNAYSDGFVSQAGPFDVDFVPRIEEGLLEEMVSTSSINE